MSRKTILALCALANMACGEQSQLSQDDLPVATASANPVAAFASSAERALAAAPLLQDTAKTVTRRVWADADLYDLSPDGRYAVQADWPSGDLVVRDMETGEVRRLTRNSGSYEPGFAEGAKFSRDGKRVAYSWYDVAEPTYFKLGVVDIDGSNPRLIHSDRATKWIKAHDWSPDGRHILALRVTEGGAGQGIVQEIVLVSAEDGSTRLLRSLNEVSPGLDRLGLSPDGRYIGYDRLQADAVGGDIFVLDVASGEEHALVMHPADDQMLGWAPDGEHILFRSDRSGTPGAWLLPVSNGRPIGDPWLVKPDMWHTSGIGFAEDGRYFYSVNTGRGDIYVVPFDPETRTVVGSPTAISAGSSSNASGARWSPDGHHVAYTREKGEASIGRKIVVQSMETGDVKEFDLGLPWYAEVHSWTTDGRGLVITVHNPDDQDNYVTLYRIDVQTGGREPLPNPLPGFPLAYPVPTPEDGFLLYALFEENPEGQGAWRIVRHDLQTGDSIVLFQTPFGAWDQINGGSLSPDGRTIAFGYAPVTGGYQSKSLVLLPVSGEEPRELPIAGVMMPAWMPDGRALLFQRFVPEGAGWEAWYLDLLGGEPRPIGLTTHAQGPGLEIHPDGRRIAYTDGTQGSELWVMENFLPEGASRR
jgi:Tol biopolymer transport system component